MQRMTDRLYLSDDGRSRYHTSCGPTPRSADIDRYFVKHYLRWTPALTLIVYSRLDNRGIHTVNDGSVALEKGARVLHIVLSAIYVDMCLADALVFLCPATDISATVAPIG